MTASMDNPRVGAEAAEGHTGNEKIREPLKVFLTQSMLNAELVPGITAG